MAQDELNVGGLMTSQFNAVKQYATEAFDLATGYIDELNSYIVGTITTVAPPIVIDPPGPIIYDQSLVDKLPDELTDSDYPTKLADAPTTLEFNQPPPITYTDPLEPDLSNIIIPDFIEGYIPPFDAKKPENKVEIPVLEKDIQPGDQYPEDELVRAVKAKLARNISNGGTMLNPQVEIDLWNRDLERNEQALQDAIDKLTAQWSKLGWSVPDGLLAGSLLGVNNEYMNKRLDLSRLIAVEQAKLEQTGMFKSLEVAIQLEDVLIRSYDEYAKRVLEASRMTTDITLQIFKTNVDLYNLSLQEFKTETEVYRMGIEAELKRVEVFKARITGEQLKASVDETKVKIYTARWGAIAQRVEIFKATVQGVALQYEAEKQKIETYKLKVDAYVAISDITAKKYSVTVEGYKAFIQGFVASADYQTKTNGDKMRGQIATVEATMKEWEVQLKLLEENVTMKLEALKTVAQTASNVAAGALSAAHASASLGFQGSTSYNQNIDLTPNA